MGFGAQNLVRDFISGFFIILEDQVRVGDLARINGRAASSSRSTSHRRPARQPGAVQVFPSGTITALANMSKQFAYAVVDVRSSREPIDRCHATLQEIGTSIGKDPSGRMRSRSRGDRRGVADRTDRPESLALVRFQFRTQPLNQARSRTSSGAHHDRVPGTRIPRTE